MIAEDKPPGTKDDKGVVKKPVCGDVLGVGGIRCATPLVLWHISRARASRHSGVIISYLCSNLQS